MDRAFDRDQKGLERALKTLDSHFAQSDAILQVRLLSSPSALSGMSETLILSMWNWNFNMQSLGRINLPL
jgi:hypothetical protein